VAGVSRCAEHEELLSAYLDGQLDATELAVVVAHLGGCEECIAAFRHLKEARSAVRLLPSLDPPPGLLPGLHPDDALSAFLDGELLSAEADAVVAHVAGCAACRAELHELDAARIAVRALPRLEPAPPVPRSVPARTQRRRVALAAAGLAMALAVGAVLAGGAAGPQVDRDSLATRHQARTSVESGFSVIPASFSPGGGR
jgi:anti-sigma factor RsiW